jgi:serine phosphatase RsbU (regulator of sigma subunit)
MRYSDLLAAVYLFVGVLTALLGLVILRENSAGRLNRVTSMMLFFASVGAVLGAGSLLDPSGADQGVRAPLVANFAYLWEFFFPTLLLFAASFPQEIPALRRHGWGELVIYLPHTIHFFLMFFATIWGTGFGLEHVSDRVPILGGLIDLTRVLLRLFFTWHRHLFSLVNLTYVGLSVSLFARNLAGVTNESLKNQLRVILLGIGIGVVLYSLGVPLNVLLDLRLSRGVSSTLLVGALATWSGTIAFAIVRYRFLDSRWIVRRTILYAVASAAIVGVYLQIARQLGKAMSGLLQISPGVLDWVALVIPLVLFQPIMGRLEESLDALMMRGRRELRSVLTRLSQEMALSLDFDALANGLVHEIPDALPANAAAVLLRAEPRSALPEFRTVAVHGFQADAVGLMEGLCSHLPDPVPMGRPHTLREWIDAAARAGKDRDASETLLRGSGLGMSYELRHGGERLGLFVLGNKISGMRYSREEVGLLSSLANQAGVALKNSLLHRENLGKAVLEEELALARKIQQAFIPSRFPKDLPVEVFGMNLPSKQVGGDYFDFFPVRGGGYALAIADVSGKGMGAALLASMLQASLRTLLQDGTPTGRVADRVNTMICESTSSDQFVTLFLAHLDLERLELTYCNAGHNYPIRIDVDGTSEILGESDLVLGIDEKISYREHRKTLSRGDMLLFYTDGVTEARNPGGDDFGEERLTGLLSGWGSRTAEEVVKGLRDEVLRFAGNGEVQDDMTLLCLRVP